jgi:hypothetical protein
MNLNQQLSEETETCKRPHYRRGGKGDDDDYAY